MFILCQKDNTLRTRNFFISVESAIDFLRDDYYNKSKGSLELCLINVQKKRAFTNTNLVYLVHVELKYPDYVNTQNNYSADYSIIQLEEYNVCSS
jgi:hypothetical protein